MPCGGRKKSPRTSSIVQIIFLFRSFEISKDIQSVQTTHVSKHTSKKVQVGKDQEKAQSERDSHSKNRGGKKTN